MKIKLLKPHRHGGVDYPAGSDLEVSQDTYEWLAERKIATYAPSVQKNATLPLQKAAVSAQEAGGDSPQGGTTPTIPTE